MTSSFGEMKKMGLTMIVLFNLFLRPHNLKLNIAKIQYCQKKVTFFGETYTVDGHQPMPNKVQAVTEMTTPTSVTELQCFLGMCNFLSKFSPRMAEISEPLHQLTCRSLPTAKEGDLNSTNTAIL